jgi:hypothetical protein
MIDFRNAAQKAANLPPLSAEEYLALEGLSDIPKGYAAVFTSENLLNTKQAIITNIQQLSELNEGDVVLINRVCL